MVARGRNEVLRGDGVDHIAGESPLGLQCVQIDVHLHLARLAARRERASCAPSMVASLDGDVDPGSVS